MCHSQPYMWAYCISTKPYFVDVIKNKVVDLRVQAPYCSPRCLRAATFFRKQLSETPAYLRLGANVARQYAVTLLEDQPAASEPRAEADSPMGDGAGSQPDTTHATPTGGSPAVPSASDMMQLQLEQAVQTAGSADSDIDTTAGRLAAKLVITEQNTSGNATSAPAVAEEPTTQRAPPGRRQLTLPHAAGADLGKCTSPRRRICRLGRLQRPSPPIVVRASCRCHTQASAGGPTLRQATTVATTRASPRRGRTHGGDAGAGGRSSFRRSCLGNAGVAAWTMHHGLRARLVSVLGS